MWKSEHRAALSPSTTRSMVARPLLAMIWGGIVCGWLGRSWWMLDLANHFMVQYLQLCLLVCLWTALRKQWKWWGCSVATALILTIRIAPYYIPDAPTRDAQSGIRLVSFNLLTSNPRKQAVLDYLENVDADVILLMELDDAWQEELSTLQNRFAYGGFFPRSDNFGIALLSRLPICGFELKYFDAANVPSVTGVVECSGRNVRFIGTHPLPPVSAAYAASRDQHLFRLADFVRQSDLPTVVFGDLNCTSWSVHFQDFLNRSGLRDSRLGKGIQASWPASFFVGRITIDHVLVSKEIRVGNRHLGPHIGSDHLPVVVQLIP